MRNSYLHRRDAINVAVAELSRIGERLARGPSVPLEDRAEYYEELSYQARAVRLRIRAIRACMPTTKGGVS